MAKRAVWDIRAVYIQTRTIAFVDCWGNVQLVQIITEPCLFNKIEVHMHRAICTTSVMSEHAQFCYPEDSFIMRRLVYNNFKTNHTLWSD